MLYYNKILPVVVGGTVGNSEEENNGLSTNSTRGDNYFLSS